MSSARDSAAPVQAKPNDRTESHSHRYRGVISQSSPTSVAAAAPASAMKARISTPAMSPKTREAKACPPPVDVRSSSNANPNATRESVVSAGQLPFRRDQ